MKPGGLEREGKVIREEWGSQDSRHPNLRDPTLFLQEHLLGCHRRRLSSRIFICTSIWRGNGQVLYLILPSHFLCSPQPPGQVGIPVIPLGFFSIYWKNY